MPCFCWSKPDCRAKCLWSVSCAICACTRFWKGRMKSCGSSWADRLSRSYLLNPFWSVLLCSYVCVVFAQSFPNTPLFPHSHQQIWREGMR